MTIVRRNGTGREKSGVRESHLQRDQLKKLRESVLPREGNRWAATLVCAQSPALVEGWCTNK